MFAELIDRRALKRRVRERLKGARVSATGFAALYLGLTVVLSVISLVSGGQAEDPSMPALFVNLLTGLLNTVLTAGFALYCMAVRRGERAEYLTLFDGFSLVGKLILLHILINVFIGLWSMLFFLPGIWAAYRYRFALYDLYEDPSLGVFEALNLSKVQTQGYKMQLFVYDFSYVGWILLSSLPALILVGTQGTAAVAMVMEGADAFTAITSLTRGLPLMIAAQAFSALVQLFYLPQMTCGELAYFDAGKRTSRTGIDNGRSDFDPPVVVPPTGNGPGQSGGDYGNPYNHGYKDEF